MGTTANYDLPYPELSDASNVPGYIQQLAEETDAALVSITGGGLEVRAGTATNPAASADTNTFVDIVFDTAMSTTPTAITVQFASALSNTPLTYWTSSKSTTGFRLNVRRNGTALSAFNWEYIAVVV